MPHHFYFDVNDGEHVTRDDEGLVFDTLESACREAIAVLPEVAREVLPNGLDKVMSAIVRDEAGTVLFRAVLVFRCEWPQSGE